jgi:N utilization substance protein A
MNGAELLRGIETLHRDKDISKDVIFASIEKAVRLAIHKRFDDEDDTHIAVTVDRATGEIQARRGDEVIELPELGRIAAQAAKQAIIQVLREEESESIVNIYSKQKGDLVHGTIQRFDGGAATVTIGKHEALLPRGEQIPGESHHVGERIKAIVLDVKRAGHRVKIILSRTHPDFVRRLFEQEIPEIEDGTISIRAVAREAGHRTKVAVSSIDTKVDCVGACVGVRGSRIKNIIDELGGERIDIVRWNDSLQVLIPNSLQPASIEEVFLYPRLGRAIVLVKEDQLSLAIGRRGQNVRLASKLVGWDIEIMTHDELNAGIEQAETWFREVPHVGDEQVEAFIEEGFLSFDDLTFLEPAELGELAGVTEEQAEEMIDYAEGRSEEIEQEQEAARAAGIVPAAPPSAQAKAAKILGDPSLAEVPSALDRRPAAPSEAKQAFESLFQPREPSAEPPAADAGQGGVEVTEETPAGELPEELGELPEELAAGDMTGSVGSVEEEYSESAEAEVPSGEPAPETPAEHAAGEAHHEGTETAEGRATPAE